MRANERAAVLAERLVSRRRVLRHALFAGAASLACAGHWPASARTRGRWRRCAPVPWRVQEVDATVLRGRGLIAGGMIRDADGKVIALDRVGIYDPDDDRWTEGPHLPATRHRPALATVHERVYAIGGATHVPDRGGRWLQCTDVFVLDGKTWWRGPPLPQPQSEAVALVHDGCVHLLGGRTLTPGAMRWTEQRDVATHRVLDAVATSWSDARPLPSPRHGAAGATIDGRLYLVGGRTNRAGDLAELVRYDPRDDRWDALRPLPRAASGLGAVTLDGMLYAFGGEALDHTDAVIDRSWRYDPITDRWTALPDRLTRRHGLAALALDGTIFAIGGGTTPALGDTTALVEAFTPA